MHYGEERGIIEKNIYLFISMPVIHTESELYDFRMFEGGIILVFLYYSVAFVVCLKLVVFKKPISVTSKVYRLSV